MVGTRVAVVGCGIAGLSAAQVLAEAGVTVVLFEREPVPGGHANVIAQGKHCTRFFLDDYTVLAGLLARVPGRRAASVLGDMRPVTRLAQAGDSGTWRPLDHLYSPVARGLGVRGRWQQLMQSRQRQHAFLVAQETFQTSTVFGSRKNYSFRQATRVVRSFLRSRSGQVLPGNTETWLIDPWVAHLKSVGVVVRLGSEVRGLGIMPERVRITTDTAEDFDAVVLATFVTDAKPLFESVGARFPYPMRQHTLQGVHLSIGR